MAAAGGVRVSPWLGRAVGLTFALLLLLLAEGGAALVLPDSTLDRILDVLERCPRVLWRQRPNLDTTFQGVPVHTDGAGYRVGADTDDEAAARPFTVVCMGASPTFGWGVTREQTYCHQLAKLMPRLQGRPVRTINMAMIGHSTHQALALLRAEVLALRPDLVTVAHVLNDVDRYRFFQSDGKPDHEVEPPSATTATLSNLLRRSHLARLLELGAGSMRGAGGLPTGGGALGIHAPGSVRVPLERYAQNLRALVSAVRDGGARVVLLKMPVNLPPGPELSSEERQSAEALLKEGREAATAGACGQAEPILNKALEQDPHLGPARYYLGACASQRGDEDTARQLMKRAMQDEARRCGRDGLRYNRAMAEVAANLKAELVDVVAALGAHKGEYLFVDPRLDPTHPNQRGHKIIARLLAGAIQGTR